MTPERWKRIDQLYDEALNHKTDERLAFLGEACGDNEDLRREVESLLKAHERGVLEKKRRLESLGPAAGWAAGQAFDGFQV